MLRGLVLLTLGLVFGCSAATPSTELIVVVDTDIAVPSQMNTTQIIVTRPDGTMAVERESVTSSSMFPLTLTVVADHDSLGPLTVVATGSLGTTEVVSRQAQVTLVRDEAHVLTLHLVRSCIGTTCPSGQTCTESGCQSVEVTNPPIWTGMPPRLGQDAGTTHDAGRSEAGILDAGPVDATTFDAPTFDAPMGDTGCSSDGQCDDGVYCNGIEHCVAGACTHPGSPCTGTTICDEASHACHGCNTRADCPPDDTGTFGTCDYADACDTSATQTRTDTIYACVSNTCTSHTMPVSQPCTRTTDGTSCGATTCGAYGACTSAMTCATSGTMTQTCSDFACSSGTCMATMRPHSMACTRTTDGTSCGTGGCGAWGACEWAGTCSTTATRHRTCTNPLCSGGSCATNTTMEADTTTCTRGTDGTVCGTSMTCLGGSCASCLPALSGAWGVSGTTFLKTVTGSGHSLMLIDGATTPMNGSVNASSATFSGTFTSNIAVWQVHATGNTITFVDWGGSLMGTITVSGATVSGNVNPPCVPTMYGCFPPTVTTVSTSGNVMTFHSSDGTSGAITFACP